MCFEAQKGRNCDEVDNFAGCLLTRKHDRVSFDLKKLAFWSRDSRGRVENKLFICARDFHALYTSGLSSHTVVLFIQI